MKKNTFDFLHIAISTAILVIALYAMWKWAAPWGMGNALKLAKEPAASICRKTPGCAKAEPLIVWRAGNHLPAPVILVSESKSIPEEHRRQLSNELPLLLSGAADKPLLYSFNLNSAKVVYAK